MKYAMIFLAAVVIAGCKNMPGSSTLRDSTDSTSYALGINFGNRFKSDSLHINPELFVRGIQDALTDSSKKLMTDQEVGSSLSRLDQELSMKRMAAGMAASAKNKKEGEDYCDQNKKREGVVTLPSGLQYEVLKTGSGPVPKRGQTVETRYKGMLVNGTEFDSSEKHGGTVRFTIDQVIPGWTEALLRMNVGSKWKLVVPSDLAYGERGAGNIIGPNQTLIFELELVSIQ